MIVGLDVSTSITGVCYLNDDGSFYAANYIDLRKVDKSLMTKAKAVEGYLHDVDRCLDDSFTHIFVEDKLSGFSGGRTSQQTIMKLAAFNGIVSWMWYHFSGLNEPIMLHPSTVKATMKRDGLIIPKGSNKKKLTLDFVREIVPEFKYVETRNGNPQPYCYDMADAYCVARAGYLKHACDQQES